VRARVEIIDNSTGEPVEAELFDEVSVEHFVETQQEWRPIVLKATRQLAKQGARELIPQHFHWDWTFKAPQLDVLANTFYGIDYAGKLQGLMKLETVGDFCRCRLPEQEGKALVYVDYVEVAPWNLKSLMLGLGEKPRFNAIGSRLVEAAVRKSLEEECKGRIGLHSLPITEQFYIKVCGMTPVGRDPAKQNLLWLECTPEQAERFLKGAGS
jgi:hypothetical protein